MKISDYLSRNVFGPLYNSARGDGAINRFTAEWSERLAWSGKETHAFALLRLGIVLREAWDYSPYYRRLFTSSGVRREDLADPDILARIPMLNKPEIRANLDSLKNSRLRPNQLIQTETGGSTSDPMVFFRDRTVWQSRWGLQHACNLALGWESGEWYALVWGARSDLPSDYSWKYRLINHLVHRRIALNAGRVDRELVDWFVEQWRRYNPSVIYGYPVMLEVLCDSFEQLGINLPRPRLVVTTAEMLSQRARETIERTIQAPVVDRYASREFGVIADQVIGTPYYRVVASSVWLEVAPLTDLDPGFGEIVITDLWNIGFPFIRYRSGDVGRLEERTVNGVSGLYLSEISGRTTDLIISPTGRVISGTAALPLFREFRQIDQAQIHQLDYDYFRVVIVKGAGYSEDTAESIKKNLCEYCGAEVRVEIEYTDNIPKDPSGKFRVVISHVAPRLFTNASQKL